MRLLLILLLIPLACQAVEISCYSNKTQIYHGYGKDLKFYPNYFSFKEKKTNDTILVAADCLITVPPNERV